MPPLLATKRGTRELLLLQQKSSRGRGSRFRGARRSGRATAEHGNRVARRRPRYDLARHQRDGERGASGSDGAEARQLKGARAFSFPSRGVLYISGRLKTELGQDHEYTSLR